VKLALCQMTSGADAAANLAAAQTLVRQAAAEGAAFICLPEYFLYYGPQENWKQVAGEQTPPALAAMSALASELRVHLSLGSVLEDVPASPKVANTSVLIGPDGAERARYRKRHLFDVNLPAAAGLPERKYCESDVLIAGDAPVVAHVDDWTVGLSICFDLRFPDHYQQLRRMGVELILVPSAFTAATGRAHWKPLLRARAIETQCYLAAAAQVGRCTPDKQCHGHSMLVDPWGRVVAEKDDGEGVILGELNKEAVDDARRAIPLF